MELSVNQIKALLKDADETQLETLSRSLAADTRKGVVQALAAARRRLERVAAEKERLAALYAFERELTGEGHLAVGLDEAGRGPLAGPLAVGAVLLGDARIEGLNDSKQVAERDRGRIAEEIRAQCIAWHVELVEPAFIDSHGMAQALRHGFRAALDAVESQAGRAQVVLIDGNPLYIDEREVNVVKGDARCASIAAASILAKTVRDAYMMEQDALYPRYGFAAHKGYGSEAHMQAIQAYGLTPIHRKSFCRFYEQPSLF